MVEATGEGMRSVTEAAATPPTTTVKHSSEPHAPADGEQYGKGVVFYLRDNKVVGLLLWNVFNRMPIARKVSHSYSGHCLSRVSLKPFAGQCYRYKPKKNRNQI